MFNIDFIVVCVYRHLEHLCRFISCIIHHHNVVLSSDRIVLLCNRTVGATLLLINFLQRCALLVGVVRSPLLCDRRLLCYGTLLYDGLLCYGTLL